MSSMEYEVDKLLGDLFGGRRPRTITAKLLLDAALFSSNPLVQPFINHELAKSDGNAIDWDSISE